MVSLGPSDGRDLRIDFFRGAALIFIFIDHMPGNGLAAWTLRNFGLSDAAEVFVLLAGLSAVLAYDRLFNEHGFLAGASRVFHRVWQIYAWHIVLVIMSAALLLAATLFFDDIKYIRNIGFLSFVTDPTAAMGQALLLYNQPNMLNILPMYVVIMAAFPVLYWLATRHGLVTAFGVSVAVWAVANQFGVNLPSALIAKGWFMNPIAWQLLLATGMIAGLLLKRGAFPVLPQLQVLCAAYLAFAFMLVAPWTLIPGLADTRILPRGFLGPIDKSNLSIWRLAHVAALGYLAFTLISPRAQWLQSRASNFVGLLGRHSLEVFAAGTILSFTGWITLSEFDASLVSQLIITTIGVGGMGAVAWGKEQRKLRAKGLAPARAAIRGNRARTQTASARRSARHEASHADDFSGSVTAPPQA